MTIKLERCGICLDWHSPKHHCANCGAYHMVVNGKHWYCNRYGIEMVRGIPLPLHRVISQLESRA